MRWHPSFRTLTIATIWGITGGERSGNESVILPRQEVLELALRHLMSIGLAEQIYKVKLMAFSSHRYNHQREESH